MEPTNEVNTSVTNKVIDIKSYKNKKREQKQTYLLIGEHYEHITLPMQITVLALSIPNPFSGNKIYLSVDCHGQIFAFDENEGENWAQITSEYFLEKVNEANEKAQGTKLEEEIQKS